MKNVIKTFAGLFVLVVTLVQLGYSEEAASVTGMWDVTISMRGEKVNEQWTIQPKGELCSATIKGPEGEKTVECEQNGFTFRSDFQDSKGAMVKVRAGLGGDRMDGSIRIGELEYLWFAKRSKT